MKIYITDCDHENIDIEKQTLSEAGMDVIWENAKSEEEVINLCGDGDIFIVQYAKITERVMQKCKNLKFIVRYGVGVDSIDVVAATKLGIQIGNIPDYGMNEVADQAISLMLALERKVILMNDQVKKIGWDYKTSIPIHRFSNQIVGIIGLGRIGRCFAKRANALGFRVLGYDPYYDLKEEDSYITKVDFDELIETSDVVTLHIPLNGNENLIDRDVLSRMKKNCYLINVARGGLIDEGALYEALLNEEIGGVGLDCMVNEPVSKNNKMFKFKNVVVTPHMAWYSEEASRELKRKVAEEAIRFANGEKIHYPINRPIDRRENINE